MNKHKLHRVHIDVDCTYYACVMHCSSDRIYLLCVLVSLTRREINFWFLLNQPKLDGIYHFLFDSELNVIPFDSKWIGKYNLIFVDLSQFLFVKWKKIRPKSNAFKPGNVILGS